ncbi:hypothetical protein [Spirochaeta cellobiosiphila]|uniref:hypothetical protein n=1 Tax=Spirochaeta cellobiosiphila TaxID=504483 RepID=UPI000403AD2D|nr:hypothetical protein [Spirochaeta cellobiosiphila]
MKRKVVSLLFLLIIIPATVMAGDRAEVWTNLFKRSKSLEQQKAILTNILKLDDRDMAPLLMDALSEYVNGSKSDTTYDQKSLRNDVTLMVVQELGDLKASEAAETVMDVYRNFEDPIVRSAALIAVGQMRALQYGEEISLILRNLNFGPNGKERENEIMAYGAILGLERMKSPFGYEPVFYASRGWYPSRTRKLAEQALDTITDDPTEFLKSVIENTDNYKNKTYAIEKEASSKAPASSKADVAFLGLKEGLEFQPDDLSQQLDLSKLRLTSIQVLNQYGKGKEEVVPYLKESAERKWDQQERLNAIVALGVNATDPAVEVLAEFLTNFNYRQTEGLNSNEDLQAIRSTIGAMVIANNSIAVPSLIEVEFSNFPGNISRLAKDALTKIED